MADAKRGDVPPTRDPVEHGRAATEGGVLTMLGVVIAWGVTLLPVEIPTAVQGAIVGLVVALGTLVFSELRNRSYALELLGKKAIVFGLALVFVAGCVSWDGPTLRGLANDEIARLLATPPEIALDPASCEALSAGAKALRNEEGDSSSIKAPFFTGQHVEEMAGVHERNALRCLELAKREAERGVTPELRGRVRAAWVKTWRNGRALHGGGE